MTELTRHTVAPRRRGRARRLAAALGLGAVVAAVGLTAVSPAVAAGWADPLVVVPVPVTVGQPATFTVVCEDPNAAGVYWVTNEGGFFQIQSGGMSVPGGKQFEVTTTYTRAGTSSFQARCSDFQGIQAGNSVLREFQVVAPRPDVTLTAPASAYAGVPFELSARVTAPAGGAIPTGTVDFLFSEGASLGSAPVVDGVARFDVVRPSAGLLDSVVAVYRGGSTYGDRSSSRVNITVAPVPVPVVTVSAPTTSGPEGLTATVTVAAPDASLAVPTGGVQLIVHTPGVGPVAVTGGVLVDGTVTLSTGALPAGTYRLLAHYSGGGSASYTQTDSAEQDLTVTVPSTPGPGTPDPGTPGTPDPGTPGTPDPGTPAPGTPAPGTPTTPTPEPTTPVTPQPTTPGPTSPVTPAPVPAPQVSTSADRTRAGAEVTLVARGFVPGERVTFVLHSDPVVLGTAVADAAGVATLTVALPAGVPAGAHRVVATGVDSGRTAEVPVTVEAAAAARAGGAELATTGADPVALTGLVAALLVSGSALALGARSRRSRG